ETKGPHYGYGRGPADGDALFRPVLAATARAEEVNSPPHLNNPAGTGYSAPSGGGTPRARATMAAALIGVTRSSRTPGRTPGLDPRSPPQPRGQRLLDLARRQAQLLQGAVVEVDPLALAVLDPGQHFLALGKRLLEEFGRARLEQRRRHPPCLVAQRFGDFRN